MYKSDPSLLAVEEDADQAELPNRHPRMATLQPDLECPGGLRFTGRSSSTPSSQEMGLIAGGVDKAAGSVLCHIITTPVATYFLDKEGLSSKVDRNGMDWIGFPKDNSRAFG